MGIPVHKKNNIQKISDIIQPNLSKHSSQKMRSMEIRTETCLIVHPCLDYIPYIVWPWAKSM